MLIIQLNSLCN